MERLQKVLASSGVASRRASEVLIAAGRVTVNGKVALVGQQVDPVKADIRVDGRPIGAASSLVYIAIHKPAGVTSTVRDRHAERTVLDFVPTALVPDGARVYPVGRLDQDSEGLIFLTNDGEWSERVLHPRFGIEREYALALRAPLRREQADAIAAGIPLDEGRATLAAPLRAATGIETRRLADLMRPSPDESLIWYRATLAQGWKRQLRRMFAAVGAPIERLVRVRIGVVRLDGIAGGTARPLKAPEVRSLGAGQVQAVPATRRGPGRPGPSRPRTDHAGPAAGGSPPSGPARSRPTKPQRPTRPRPPRPPRPPRGPKPD